MTQFTCVHCGRPVQAGNLCGDCQALRAYHPDVFYAQNNGVVGTGIDKSVVFAVASVVVLALLVGVSWPFVQRAMKTDKSVASSPAPVNKPIDAQPRQQDVVYTPPRTYDLPVYVPPVQTPTQPVYQPPYRGGNNLNVPVPAIPSSSYPYPVSQVSNPADNSRQAESTLPAFIQGYCAARKQETGNYVRPLGITMMLDGAGALLSFDEGGSVHQGSAQFTSMGGWSWIQSPDA